MNTKTTFAALSLTVAAVFSAQAQSVNDPYDQAGYGAMPAATAAVTTAAAKPAAQAAKARVFAIAGNGSSVDAIDQAAYGAMPTAGVSLRTRAEVRAEAIAARDAGVEANWREGGDPQYAVMNRARSADAAHVVAGTAAKAAQ